MTPMSSSDDVLAQVAVAVERIDAVSKTLTEFRSDVNKKFDDMTYVPRAEYDLRVSNNERHIAAIEERLRWAGRALITAILMTPLSVAITTWVVTK